METLEKFQIWRLRSGNCENSENCEWKLLETLGDLGLETHAWKKSEKILNN